MNYDNVFVIVIIALVIIAAFILLAYWLGVHEGYDRARDELEAINRRRGVTNYVSNRNGRRRIY